MSWVKVGRWVFQIDAIVAVENRVDGAEVKLRGNHALRLNKAETEAFLRRFGKGAAIEDLGVVQDPL